MANTTVTLKASHFRTKGKSGRVVLADDMVSNGWWALKRERIVNAALFVTEETARAALNLEVTKSAATFASVAGPTEAVAWSTTAVLFDAGYEGIKRILRNEAGVFAALPCSALTLFSADSIGETFYGADPEKPFRDAEKIEDATAIIMPTKLPKGFTMAWENER